MITSANLAKILPVTSTVAQRIIDQGSLSTRDLGVTDAGVLDTVVQGQQAIVAGAAMLVPVFLDGPMRLAVTGKRTGHVIASSLGNSGSLTLQVTMG